MAKKTYTYDPSRMKNPKTGSAFYGLDRMRFELGDTMVEGGEQTCALCDEEYAAIIPDKVQSVRHWKKTKLQCLESIMRRFAYEPDQKVGPADIKFGERAKLWKQMYDDLAAELSKTAVTGDVVAKMAENPGFGAITPPYFYNGMMSHEEVEGQDI